MTPAEVTFWLPPGEPVETLAGLDPDRDWHELQRGERAWILQAFLRLRAAGARVALSAEPGDGVVVYHGRSWRKLERQLREDRRARSNATLVAVRGDLRPTPNADLEIVQDPCSASSRRLYVPHWPQPALLARDAERGDVVRRAAFKGIRESMHPALRTPAWASALAGLGVEWDGDETAYASCDAERASLRWPDYRDVDVVVALRPGRGPYPGKPATKLFNAWLAGTPAVLGRERAYRAVRRSPLDYIEASSPREALDAVGRLALDRGLHREMVENGRERAREFTCERVVGQWKELVEEQIPALAASQRHCLPRPLRLFLGHARRRLGRG